MVCISYTRDKRLRDSASDSARERKQGWAVETSQNQDYTLLHQFMLQQLAQNPLPSEIVPRSAPSTVAEPTIGEEEALKVDAAEAESAPKETPRTAEVAIDASMEQAIAEEVTLKEEAVAAEEEETVVLLSTTAEQIDVVNLEPESAPSEQVQASSVYHFSERLERLSSHNDLLYNQRADAKRVRELLDDLPALLRLHSAYAQLHRRSVPQLKDEVARSSKELAELIVRMNTEIEMLLAADAALAAHFEEHPGRAIALTDEINAFMQDRAGSCDTRFVADAEETADDNDAAAPVTIMADAATVEDIEDSALSLDSKLNAAQEEPEAQEPAFSVSDSSVPPGVEIDPGLTLRSTTTQNHDSGDALSDDEYGPQLIVSSEKHVDWRDLLFKSAQSPQRQRRSLGGQSHIVFKAIGGGGELGSACYMLELVRYDKRILVDAGLRLRDAEICLHEAGPLPRPDLIIVTHSHLDHCGALPYLARLWPGTPIWCQARAIPFIEHSLQLLCRPPLADPLFVAPEAALYSASEVNAVKLIGKEFEQPYRLFESDLRLTFWRSGHTVGAAGFSLEGDLDSLFFTGEYAVHDEPSVRAAVWPERRFDVAIASCSGVADKIYDRTAMQKILVNKVREIIAKSAWAVFPLAETGRAQDIFLLLAAAMRAKELPQAPIYWDGAQRRLAMLYNRFSDERASGEAVDYLHEPGIQLSESARSSLSAGPGILLTNPGALQDGAVMAMLQRLISVPGSAVFLPVRADSPVDLKQLLRNVKGNYEVPSYSWPAHPSEEEMVKQLRNLSPYAVLLVHGTQEMQRNLRAALPPNMIRRSLSTGETLRIRPEERK